VGAEHRQSGAGELVAINLAQVIETPPPVRGRVDVKPARTGIDKRPAQGPVSVGGFSADTGTGNSISKNFVTAGRVPEGAVIARDMITNLQQDPSGFSYVLTTPDYKTATHAVQALNKRFGGNTAHALDAATVRVTLPGKYVNDPVGFLADAGDLRIDADQLAKVVINERTGTIVMGGDITLAPVAIAHGNLSITIATTNQAVPAGPFSNAPTGTCSS